MSRRILIFILILIVSIGSFAQTTDEKVADRVNFVKLYGESINKLTQKDYDGAIAGFTDLIEKAEKETDFSSGRLASYYRARGQGFLHKGNYLDAETDYKRSIFLMESAEGKDRAELNKSLYQLSLVYYYWEKPSAALAVADRCVEVASKFYGPNHSETLDAIILRSNLKGFYNDGRGALDDRKKCFEIIRRNIERNFAYLTSEERKAYWEKYLPETMQTYAFVDKLNETQSEYTDMLFNQQLLSKGLLLTAESELQRSVDNDPELKSAYRRIRLLRKKASDSQTDLKTSENATFEADRIERELGNKASSLHRFMDFLKVIVADVKGRLGMKDIAVEFVDYKIGKDSTMYAALVVSPRWKNARFIPIAEKTEIEESKNIAELVWRPILDCVGKELENIYFAPTGMLYTLPLESLPLSDGKMMFDQFNIYRMSSTRWLAFERTANSENKAIVYGGLLYNMSIDELVEDTKKYEKMNRSVEVDDSLIDRGSVSVLPYLPGTLDEADNISRTIKENSPKDTEFKVTLYTDRQGTETSFKAIGGQHMKIIHIATHGFFSSKVDDPMVGSGLYFAGANNKYRGKSIPSGTDDGILTAREISEIDLQGLDLVVLSACQTGLGDITPDGVQGLQRGFKKAGAKSIIMSLWSVDDEATKLLMTTFYDEYLGGKTKLKAFDEAKRKVRGTEGFDNPRFWSAFVLLDGN